jgi:hypothetical protein
MTDAELTGARRLATVLPMQAKRSKAGRWRKWLAPLVLMGSATLGGCISVNAPDKPIVIELNINIRQEVIYRLAEDAGKTIENNADIF